MDSRCMCEISVDMAKEFWHLWSRLQDLLDVLDMPRLGDPALRRQLSLRHLHTEVEREQREQGQQCIGGAQARGEQTRREDVRHHCRPLLRLHHSAFHHRSVPLHRQQIRRRRHFAWMLRHLCPLQQLHKPLHLRPDASWCQQVYCSRLAPNQRQAEVCAGQHNRGKERIRRDGNIRTFSLVAITKLRYKLTFAYISLT